MNDEMVRNLKRFHDLLYKSAKNVNVVDLLRKIYATFLDQKSSALRLIVDERLQSYTDGKTIVISLIPDLLKDEYSTEDWLIALKAVLAHESQHVNSSNFDDIVKIRDWYGKQLATEAGVDELVGARIGKDMLNIVEDGRIEAIAVQRRPGMFLPFMYLNQIIREGTRIEGVADNAGDEFADFMNNILSFAKTGLYAPGIKVYAKTRLEENFLKIEQFITDGVQARTSHDCRVAVTKILDAITPYIKELVQDESLQEQMKQPPQTEYSSNNESQYNDGGSSSLRSGSPTQTNPQQDNKGDSQQKSDSQSANQDDSQNGDGGSDSSEPDKDRQGSGCSERGFSNAKKSTPLSNERLNEIRQQMSRQLKAAPIPKPTSNAVLDQKGLKKVASAYQGAQTKLIESKVEVPAVSEMPQELKAQAQQLRRAIMKIVDQRRQASKNLRRGALNMGDLWKTGIGDQTIFERKTKLDKSSIAFYLLIDNSGSMNMKVNKNLKKYEAARSAAAIIEEASKAILPCKIALFNQPSNVSHQVIKDFDENPKRNLTWNSLRTISPDGCNADSVNIRIATEELSKRREVRKVLFVLSDGLPNAYGSKENACWEVQQAVKDARNAGIIVVPIMFGDEEFRENSLKSYQQMYEKNIISCDPQAITATLARAFRLILAR